MADLYGTSDRCPSLESEGMFSFLHNILHNSLTSPSSSSRPPFEDNLKQSFSSLPPPQPAAATTTTSSSTANLDFRSPMISASDSRFREKASTGGSSVMPDSSAGFYFSGPGWCFVTDAKKCKRNAFSATCVVDSEGITSKMKRKFPSESVVDEVGSDCKKGPEASEAPANPAPPPSSRKSRTAEVHNLSEKRRRIRINEKMKALQKLIPNSNKTDKASMLDEAIEYLKQLQRQVQMLSMRNGFGLHPYLPESLHPTQLPQEGVGYDEGNVLNTNRGEDTFSLNQESSMLAALDLPNVTPSNQPNIILLRTSIPSSETSCGLEPSIHNDYGLLDHLTSSKVTLLQNSRS